MFLNLQAFALEEQDMMFSMNVLLTFRPRCDLKYLPSNVFDTLVWRIFYVSCCYLIELMFLALDE